MSFGSLDFQTELRVWQQICAEVVNDEPHRATLVGKRISPELREALPPWPTTLAPKLIAPEQIAHMFFLKLLTPPDYRGFGKAFLPIGDDAEWAAALRDEVTTWYARVKRERAEKRRGVS